MKPIFSIFIAVVALGVGFLSGYKTYEFNLNKRFASNYGFNANTPGGERNGRMMIRNGNQTMGLRPLSGEVLSVDDNSLTIKTADGGSKVVVLSEKTSFNKSESTTKSDIKTGSTVRIFGSENQDGSVSAQDIQINPTLPNIDTK